MKKRLIAFLLFACLQILMLSGCAQNEETDTTNQAELENKVIRCSTTTSVNDSGLLPFLEPLFEEETGYDLQITSNGTGAAIKLGETGDADVLLVHSKAAEEEFIEAGYGIERIPFMQNFFVIVGPEDDPASVSAANSATEAFKAIANTNSRFVSRGDESGTHNAELKIWTASSITPDSESDEWYISAGAGMGTCLTRADELSAYILTDKATFLSMKENLELTILLSESDDTRNVYSLIACNPEKNEGLNTQGANDFINWMTKEETLGLIAEYGVQQYGEPLFFTIDE